jgi:carbon-monoxide dehydrogenase iron sulfur subunit
MAEKPKIDDKAAAEKAAAEKAAADKKAAEKAAAEKAAKDKEAAEWAEFNKSQFPPGTKVFKILVTDPGRCTGCETCESVCSMVHDGEFNPLNSRINRVRIEPRIDTAVNCQSCANPDCVEACQPKALTKDSETGLIKVDLTKCDGCGICVRSCPFGAINVHTKKRKAMTCDLCASTSYKDPQCIEFCPKKAIFVRELDASMKQGEMLDIVEKILKKGFPGQGMLN